MLWFTCILNRGPSGFHSKIRGTISAMFWCWKLGLFIPPLSTGFHLSFLSVFFTHSYGQTLWPNSSLSLSLPVTSCFLFFFFEIPLPCPQKLHAWKLWFYVKAEALILWPPDANSWLMGKDPAGGKDWRQKEKRVTEDEKVGWHHRFNGHELGKTLGNGEGQGSLVCCSPLHHNEPDTTWWLNNSK